MVGILTSLAVSLVSAFSRSSAPPLPLTVLSVAPGIAGLVLLIVAAPAHWLIQNSEQKHIALWLQIYRPSVWREISAPPAAGEPADETERPAG